MAELLNLKHCTAVAGQRRSAVIRTNQHQVNRFVSRILTDAHLALFALVTADFNKLVVGASFRIAEPREAKPVAVGVRTARRAQSNAFAGFCLYE